MVDAPEKIKEFLEEKTEEIGNKIEKTPMEKFFVFFLILITIAALGLGYLQFKKNLEQPLYASYLQEKRGEIKEKYQAENLNNIGSNSEIVKLQQQDSDLDGLDDYSEIYVYKTSAYLEDTDGDGILDKQEILAGTDPNCPEGQDCTIQPFNDTSSNQNVNAAGNTNQSVDSSSSAVIDYNNLLDLEQQLLSGETTLEELGIDDPQLQALFDQVSSGELQNLNQLPADEKNSALDSLKDLSPEEIRQELESRGIDKNTLDQIDDQTLQKMFLDTLKLY